VNHHLEATALEDVVVMLENLTPASKITAPKDWRPAVEFDGTNGLATTPPTTGDQPDFTQFLIDQGFDPERVEIYGPVRTSRWQQREGGDWLVSWRFNFRMKAELELDLPTLYAQAKKTKLPVTKKTAEGKALVIVPADFQVGKTGSRGNTQDLIARVFASYERIEQKLKKGGYEKVIILDAGDMIESVQNAAQFAQLESNDLSPMQQVDMAASLLWDLLKIASKYGPVTYASVGSNHCQWRFNGQAVGKPGLDDWGIVILQQLRRLSTELGMDVTYLIPDPYDESLAFDVFDDGFHIVALAHGHQAKRPNGMEGWLQKQGFSHAPVNAFTVFVSGHFHHLRVEELGQSHNGGSRYWIQASTMDNGSDWFRLQSGTDSVTGIVCFELERQTHFQGTVYKL
jgi:hypothetical protein